MVLIMNNRAAPGTRAIREICLQIVALWISLVWMAAEGKSSKECNCVDGGVARSTDM
jgi:hypothetical protein